MTLPYLQKEIILPSIPEDERIWVPQPGCPNVKFRPLLLDTVQGLFVNLLKSCQKGIVNKHRHHGTVHGYVIKGTWCYLEHDWVAKPGDYVFEPPGETHTLYSDSDDETITLFTIAGGLTFLDDNDNVTSYMDVFTKIEACQKHYSEVGLGRDYVKQFIR